MDVPFDTTSSFMTVPSRPRTGVASGITVSFAALSRNEREREKQKFKLRGGAEKDGARTLAARRIPGRAGAVSLGTRHQDRGAL